MVPIHTTSENGHLYVTPSPKKCTPEQIAQTVKHLASVIKTVQEQQGLDIVLTDWTHSEPGDSIREEPPSLIVRFNESFYHPVPPDDEKLPF